MTRPLRLNIANGYYHIINRGIRKDKIFYNDKDKSVFLDKLDKTSIKYNFYIIAYCLMDNHYHLFINTQEANLCVAMHYFNSSYANWFKAKYKLEGSIYQSRYKSILVDKDNYANQLSAYIHLNPVRVNIVNQPEDYLWSSCSVYFNKRESYLNRLDVSIILNQLHKKRVIAVKIYKNYINDLKGKSNNLFKNINPIGIGDKNFIKLVKGKIEEMGYKREVTETHLKKTSKINKDQILEGIVKVNGISKKMLFEKVRSNTYRKLAIHLIKNYTDLSLKKIGEIFNLDYTSVSTSNTRFEKEMQRNKEVLIRKAEVLKYINKI